MNSTHGAPDRSLDESLHYSFEAAIAIDEPERPELLGGKGAALVHMTAIGLPVPPGFILTTQACSHATQHGWSTELDEGVERGLVDLERTTERTLGSGTNPLLVSVRSGAPRSMPGMMDTVLNVGMTDGVAGALGAAAGDAWFGWDTARRFIQSYGSIVLGVPGELMGSISAACLGPDEGRGLEPDELAAATRRMQALLGDEGFLIPPDPRAQLRAAVQAVFASWNSERAHAYRRVEQISEDLGTAATIQMMTFGNLGARSGTGVVFTRDPSTGAPGLVGDFLVGAQGEDVVAGTHTTLPISALRSSWPELADELDLAATRLERELCDLVDIEFTIEDGTLWLLQVRPGKRSPLATLRVAIDLAEDPAFALTRAEAVERVRALLADPPSRTEDTSHLDGHVEVLAKGLAASPGRAVGRLCTDIDDAIVRGGRGEAIILVRRETSPADIAAMAEASGLVTTLGGLVSHAAVIARSWAIPAVVGASGLTFEGNAIVVDGRRLEPGTMLTVDGDRGAVLLGEHGGARVVVPEVATLRRWQRDAESAPCHHSATDDREPDAATPVEWCERVLALKGVATSATIAEVLGCPLDEIAAIVAGLIDAGSAQELPGARVRLLPPAIDRVDASFRHDALVLGGAIEPLWEQFHHLDGSLKQVVAAWQVRPHQAVVPGDLTEAEGVPNDHLDAAYDALVIDRLHWEVHAGIGPVLATLAASDPRFDRYRARLDRAIEAIDAGDQQMVAHPIRDSYHTIWFELHEELIRLSGRNRADEAAIGRA